MRQFITQDVGTITDAQNADTHRRRSHDFAVELFMLLQPEGILFRWQEHFAFEQPRQAEQHHG
ncbi:hypothetical protein D3C71_1962160 [compost metagenome]